MDTSFDIDYTKLPIHVALIMDGNGRWASNKNLPKLAGHNAGMSSLKKAVRFASNIGIKHLTVYAFSTENWKRSTEEVSGIFQILVHYMQKEINELNRKNVKMVILGDYSAIPEKAKNAVNYAVQLTDNNTGLQFNIALNYGGRDEITKAAKKIALDVNKGLLSPDEIDENTVNKYLYTADIPDPDLVIRTSGEQRLSNFLLWQSAYSEFYFTETLWPDFDENAFLKAIENYQHRKRNFGGR